MGEREPIRFETSGVKVRTVGLAGLGHREICVEFATEALLDAALEFLRYVSEYRPATQLYSSQDVRIGLAARSRVHCSNSMGDTFPRELWGRMAL